MQRILIIGPSASGKSTFARALAARHRLQSLHQDIFFFDPANKPIPHSLAVSNMCAAAPASGWVIEGNYNQVINAFLPLADTVIFLNFNRFATLYRVIKRRMIETADSAMTPGGQHRVPFHFIKYILQVYPRVQRQQRLTLQQNTTAIFQECRTFTSFLKLQQQFLK